MPTQLSLDWNRILSAIQTAAPNQDSIQAESWQLIEGFLKKFSPYDLAWTILHVEPEMFCWLDEFTLIVGRVDLIARNSTGDNFFGEWKTANPRRKGKWQSDWIMSPQSLTYGFLTRYGKIYGAGNTIIPTINKFHVRAALKSKPPSYEYEWFSYTDDEIAYWLTQIKAIAGEIRSLRLNAPDGPWMPNFSYCNRYGDKYMCPFLANGCSKLNWGNTKGLIEKTPHLQVIRDNPDPKLVILDATRIDTYLNCREKYRQVNERHLDIADSEALGLGTAFHAGIAEYFRQLQGV